MKKALITILSLALLSNVTNSIRAQERDPVTPWRTEVRKAELDSLIPRLMKDGEVPGLAIAVIKDGKISLNQGFGVMNATTKEPVTNATIFEAASLSKPVFAYAVLKLVDAGKLDLDKPLIQYLGKAYIENDERINLITARRVLTHTTGFPNWRPRNQPLKIIIPPGERFSYSGEGFVYLQKVVEHLSGESFDVFMKHTVFDPLDMKSSSYVWQPAYETLKATGHVGANKPGERRKPTEANAAASLQTTSLDYAKFVIAVMNGTGLKAATRKAMLTSQIQVDEGCRTCTGTPPSGKLSPYVSWGFGIGLQQTRDGLAFWHWGDNGDVHCYALGYPDRKSGIVVLTNSGNGLSIIPEIIGEAVGGQQPAIAWIGYEAYNSPGKLFYKDILARGVVAIDEYREKKKTAPSLNLNEAKMNSLGYALLGDERVKEAIEIFKINTEDFPASANTYDSLGEAYMIAGEKELAIKNYEKSVELNPKSDSGIAALKKLRGQ
ncbi:MAG: serine hydrolase [Acidobacteriota bacterium]|nr:serine hydrolase [Acidobacteriota bacterium]